MLIDLLDKFSEIVTKSSKFLEGRLKESISSIKDKEVEEKDTNACLIIEVNDLRKRVQYLEQVLYNVDRSLKNFVIKK